MQKQLGCSKGCCSVTHNTVKKAAKFSCFLIKEFLKAVQDSGSVGETSA